MSLVTNPRHVHVEGLDLFDSASSTDSSVEARFLRALRAPHAPPSTSRSPRHASSPQRDTTVSPAPRRRADPAAMARLLAPTAACLARAQRKYTDRPSPSARVETARVSSASVRAGERLYLAARGQQRRAEALVAAKRLAEASEAAPSFRPRITPLAAALVGHRPLYERGVEAQTRRLQREGERAAREVAACTFRPHVAPASSRLARRGSEPFADAGERLFVDGGHRLIRQQLRRRVEEQRAARGVIGGFAMSQTAATALAARLHDWQTAREKRRDALARVETDAPRTAGGEGGELRRLHLRALFAKYAASAGAVRLRDVKRQVRELFPADSGVAAALAADVGETDALDRSAFVACLERFERRHGPQPWGEPRCAELRAAVAKASSPTRARRSRTPDEARGSAADSARRAVAEIEALLETPSVRSATATPRRRRPASTGRGVNTSLEKKAVVQEVRRLLKDVTVVE